MTVICKWKPDPAPTAPERVRCKECGKVRARKGVRLCKGGAAPDVRTPSHHVRAEQQPDGVNVGTELTRILKRYSTILKWATFGLRNLDPRPGCKCQERAKIMDYRGAHWCERHKEEIVDWLEEEAIRAGFNFKREDGLRIVKRAIRNANRKAGR